jgi:hypothetical protein
MNRMARSNGERRGEPRAEVRLPCTLRRPHGTPVTCETVEIGPGGMSVASRRPLAQDEMLRFDLPAADGQKLCGEARVLRQHGHEVYALAFEHLQEAVRLRLERFVRV